MILNGFFMALNI